MFFAIEVEIEMPRMMALRPLPETAVAAFFDSIVRSFRHVGPLSGCGE